ncbi:MAG: PKD domain-containing protein [Bacteroidota bacterium]
MKKSTLLTLWQYLLLALMAGAFTSQVSGQCISTFPYFEDFENGKGGWKDSALYKPPLAPPSALRNSWAFGTPNKTLMRSAASGDSCWWTLGSRLGIYFDNEFSYVESPCFDFTSLNDPLIGISLNHDMDGLDGAALFSSVDTGKTWQIVGTSTTGINWYNSTNIGGTPGTLTAPFNLTGWTRTTPPADSGWVRAQHDLVGLGGVPHVRFRIYFGSNNIIAREGFAFDDVAIVERDSLNLGPDTVLCFGEVLRLDAGQRDSATYLWSTQDTTQTIVVASQNIYTVLRVDSLGFAYSDTIIVTVSNTNIPPLPSRTICPGDTACLNPGNANANHQWYSFNQRQQQFVPSDTNQIFCTDTTGTFVVEVRDRLGCLLTDTIAIRVDSVPTVNIGADDTICVGSFIILTSPAGPPGTVYDWTVNGNLLATTQSVFASAPGEYKVILTTPAGCQERDSMVLGVVLSPIVNLGPDRIECDTINLNAANPGASFQWSTGSQTQSVDVFTPPTVTRPYSVTVTNAFGCSASDTVNITGSVPPVANLGPDTLLCGISSILLDPGNAGAGATYSWSFQGQTSQTLSVNSPGQYFVTITDGVGCVASDTVNITISPLRVDLGGDTVICAGKTLTLNAAANNATYVWTPGGQTTPDITINSGGFYGVTVSDNLGCVLSDNINVTQRPAYFADFTVGPSFSMELGDPHTFTGGANATSWFWDLGDGTKISGQVINHTYAAIDTYTVCLTMSDGFCTDTICKEAGVRIFVGMDDILGAGVKAFPNPTDGIFNVWVMLTEVQPARLEVFDLTGRNVHSDELASGTRHEASVDLGQEPDGIYLLRLTTPKGALYEKIVKQ